MVGHQLKSLSEIAQKHAEELRSVIETLYRLCGSGIMVSFAVAMKDARSGRVSSEAGAVNRSASTAAHLWTTPDHMTACMLRDLYH